MYFDILDILTTAIVFKYVTEEYDHSKKSTCLIFIFLISPVSPPRNIKKIIKYHATLEFYGKCACAFSSIKIYCISHYIV